MTTVTLNAADALSGMAMTLYALDGGAEQSYSGPFVVTGDGAHTVVYRSVDVAGNQESAQSASFSITTVTPTAAVRPLLECVRNNGNYTAFFGYSNENTVQVSIPIGANNKFAPLPIDRGQPSLFQPGQVVSAFSVAFDGSKLTWSVKGPDGRSRSATASRTSKACR